MNRFIRSICILALIVTFSCEKGGYFVICSECKETEPVRAELEAKLENEYYQSAVIEVFEGNLEDNILYGTYTAHSNTFQIDVPLNKKYTVTASYNINGVDYVVVDSATPEVKYDKNQCSNPCYFIYNRVVNLRLKNSI